MQVTNSNTAVTEINQENQHQNDVGKKRKQEYDEVKEVKKGKKDDYVGPLYNEQSMRKSIGQKAKLKVLSWNVAGLRSLLNKNQHAIRDVISKEEADVLCVQETRLQEAAIKALEDQIREQLGDDWKMYWNCSTERKGYSGTAVFTNLNPIKVSYGLEVTKHDNEGRVIILELEDVYVVNVYVPNSGAGLKRLDYRVQEWDTDFSNYVKDLVSKKESIIVGDFNCAHKEIDIRRPKNNKRSAGFTIEERNSFQEVYIENGFVDTFRHLHPGIVAYSYWGYRYNCREKNIGWRLDYCLVSEGLLEQLGDSFMLQSVMGSDHCPIGITLKENKEE